MQLPTVRIELTNGGWAVLYKDVLRRTTRMHEALLREHMEPIIKSEKVKLSELTEETPPMVESDYLVDLASVNPNDVNEIYIMGQMAEWSLGDVSKATLEMITDADYKVLVKEMDRLYKPNPLARNCGKSSAKAST